MLALRYSCMWWKEAQRESTKLCRLSGVFWNERCCFVQVTWCWDQDTVGVYTMGGKENGGVGEKMGYIWSSSGDYLVQHLGLVGSWTQNGPAIILQNHQPPHVWQALRWDLVLTEQTVNDAGHCICIPHHFNRSDLVHLGANWVVPRLSQLYNHPAWLPMSSSEKSTCNWCHRIENTSLFSLRCF